MAKQYETGHAINVDNFYELIQFVTTYGATYNPMLDALKIPQLSAQHTAGLNALQSVTNQVTSYNNTVNLRMEVFAPSKPLATRVINVLETSGASADVIKDAKTINRKIQGKRAKTITEQLPPDNQPPATISASQQSYAQTIEHWAALISLLQSQVEYAPNEAALQTSTLQEMHTAMIEANDNVANEWALISNVRNQRDQVLYNPETGIVKTAELVKKYVKALYGSKSIEFTQVNHIPFRTIKRG